MKNTTKWYLSIAVVIGILGTAVVAGAATASYRTHRGDTIQTAAKALGETPAQFAAANPKAILISGQTFTNTTVTSPPPSPTPPPPTPTPSPVPPPPPSTPPPANETRFTAYTTGYGFPDNTPPSADISNGVIHSSAGGTGTFSDPITLAVGHTISGGKDTLDYPEGTKFYIPNLRRYFITEDTCGDGNTPQNGPCHTGYQGHVWIDLWVGGQGLSSSGTLSCEDAITDLHLAIENPASNYAVVSGPVYNGTCSAQFGDTVVTQ